MSNERKSDGHFSVAREAISGAYLIVAIAFTFALVVVLAYALHFSKSKISNDPEKWGQLGDYVGGLVNPVVGLATVALVFITLMVQRAELQASLKELKQSNSSAVRQSFEQSLFAWIGNYRELLASIKRPDGRSGRQALHFLYELHLSPNATVHMGRSDAEIPLQFKGQLGNEVYIRLRTPNEGLQQLSLRLKYAVVQFQNIYGANPSDFDGLFRTLYRLLRWIDQSELLPSEKWHYAALVRAQLSFVEMIFLFYNGATRNGGNFAILANKYALFDNLKGSDGLVDFAIEDYTPSIEPRPKVLDDGPWPYTSAAFSSAIAKVSLGISLTT